MIVHLTYTYNLPLGGQHPIFRRLLENTLGIMKPQILIEALKDSGLITQNKYQSLTEMLKESNQQTFLTADYLVEMMTNQSYDYFDRLKLFFGENEAHRLIHAKWNIISKLCNSKASVIS